MEGWECDGSGVTNSDDSTSCGNAAPAPDALLELLKECKEWCETESAIAATFDHARGLKRAANHIKSVLDAEIQRIAERNK